MSNVDDLRGLFAWAHAASERQTRRRNIDRLRDLVARRPTCGDCEKWMHSRECPMERNVNGWNKGPSMNAPTCTQYVEKPGTTRDREQARVDLAVAVAEDASAGAAP